MSKRKTTQAASAERYLGFLLLSVSACTSFADGDDRLNMASDVLSNQSATADNADLNTRLNQSAADGNADEPSNLRATEEPETSTPEKQTDENAIATNDPWWCLNELINPGVEEATQGAEGTQVALRIRYYNYGTQMVVTSGIEIRACDESDVLCAQPVVDWQPVPSSGQYSALVPWGFTGFLEVRGEEFPPQITVLDTPLYRDLELYSHALLRLPIYVALGNALQAPINPNLSLLTATALDCNGSPAPGVEVRTDIDNPGVAYALAQGLPTANETVSQRDGLVGYANAPPGSIRLSATLPDGREIDQQSVLLRAGTHTTVFMRPNIWSLSELCGGDGARLEPGTIASAGLIVPCERQ